MRFWNFLVFRGNPTQSGMIPAPEPSDETLFETMRSGDEAAFVALYRRRQGAVYRYVLQMSGSATTAEEVTQEVFVLLIRRAGGFNAGRGPLLGWLLGAARHVLRKMAARNGMYVPLEEGDEPESGAPAAGHPLEDLTRGERLEAVQQAVQSLPERYREAVVLCDLEELSYEDAARVLGCAVGTVRSRLHRGRALVAGKLRARLMTEER